VKTARLPFKRHESDPEWEERECHKPEGLIDWLRLHFGPGEWARWNFDGGRTLLRVMPAKAEDPTP
jgi:hypothetical protein